MTEDYVSFETAKMLKEAGFDERCDSRYTNKGELYFSQGSTNSEMDALSPGTFNLMCPTQSLAAKWIRKVYKLSVEVWINEMAYWHFNIANNMTGEQIRYSEGMYDEYEQAMDAGLQRAMKIIKEGTEIF